MLTQNTNKRVELSQQCLPRFEREVDDFLQKAITCDNTRVLHYEPESKRQSLGWKHGDSLIKKKFKSQVSIGKVCLQTFGIFRGPIPFHSLKKELLLAVATIVGF